jgi:glycosyltransferase involved in cell wall biosynthesis
VNSYTPAISVVVPAFQASSTIEPCLRALAAQSLPRHRYEVIVVDDASSDNTADLAARAGAQVVRLAHNAGPSAARNAGVAIARGDLVVFTDADCEPTPGFLAGLTSRLADPCVGGTKGVYVSRQRAVVARFVQQEYEQRYEHTARQRSVDFVDTYACCFRRADIIRIGGFDPHLRICEDQDLSFRLTGAGVRIEFAPDARTYHLHCANAWAYVRKKFRIARWKIRVLRRHPTKVLHDSHTPLLLKLQIVAAYLACVSALCAGVVQRERAHRMLALLLLTYIGLIGPFVASATKRDPILGLAAPFLLLGRDLALGAGIAFGSFDVLADMVRGRTAPTCVC